MQPPRSEWRFLYRSDQGRIDRPTWWRAQAPLAAALLVLTLIWLALSPYAHRSLDSTKFFDPGAIVAYTYLIVYAFAVLLIAVASYSVSAKRFRARGMAPGLAGLLPFTVFATGVVAWTQEQDGGMFPFWIVVVAGIGCIAIAVWTIHELGVAGPRENAE